MYWLGDLEALLRLKVLFKHPTIRLPKFAIGIEDGLRSAMAALPELKILGAILDSESKRSILCKR